MNKFLATLALVAGLTFTGGPSSASTATQSDYDSVQVGWTRAHVQRVFDDRGIRDLMWAGPHRRHLTKEYYLDTGQVAIIEYVGPLTNSPFGPPYWVQSKTLQTIRR